MRILIAEDNLVNRHLMEKLLQPVGECVIADDGAKAVDFVRQALEQGQPYDLVCMDVMMPNMDGHDAVSAIRQLEKDKGIPEDNQAKVIMTTAVDSASSFKIAETCGANGYLIKPVRKLQLYDELEKLGLVSQEFISEQLLQYRTEATS